MIGICFVVHNQLVYTKRFVESIARNSYPHQIGFFCLDNGSSDGSLQYLSGLKINPMVILKNRENESLSKSWNRVLKAGLEAGADVLCLSNNDVIVGPGWLDAIMVQVKFGEKAYWLPNGSVPEKDFDQTVKSKPKTGKTYHGRAGWCLFFKKETVSEFLPIPEELRLWYGDDYIHWKLKAAGYRCLTVDDCYAYHYISKTVQIIGPIQSIIDADRMAYHRITGEYL